MIKYADNSNAEETAPALRSVAQAAMAGKPRLWELKAVAGHIAPTSRKPGVECLDPFHFLSLMQSSAQAHLGWLLLPELTYQSLSGMPRG